MEAPLYKLVIVDDTEVVNVKVSYIRPRYNSLKEWVADPQNVYIGRRGIVILDGARFPPQDSIWANPYKVGTTGKGSGTVSEVIEKYRLYITSKIQTGQITPEQLRSLKGRRLGCWCKPGPCHGDVLLEIIRNF